MTISSSHVIRGISESLKSLIRAHVSELSSESAVVFESPADIEAYGENKLSLFLYQIENNPFLSNVPPQLDSDKKTMSAPTTVRFSASPLVVDLYYLMVPYAKSTELELIIVDKLARLFHDYAVLAEGYLRPVLKQTGNTAVPIVPSHLSEESIRNIWNGFPGKSYKLTKMYTLSPVIIPSGRSYEEYVVLDGELTVEKIP
jgi:hypothetical protein